MAAITPAGRAELVALFLTMFGEAPTTLQLSRMVTAREQGASLLQIATAAAAELEVDFALVASMDAESFAQYLVDTLLAADIVASERDWALDWVQTSVQSKSKLEVIIDAVTGLRATTSPAYASSQAQLTASVTAALNVIDNPVIPGQSLSLTTGADAFTTNNANDTFVATEATLSSADILNGGNGTDTLRYASSGNAAVNEAGFETSGIEIAQITADAVGGTTFDTTGMTGVTTLRNSNSSEDVTLVGMSSLVGIELVAVGSAGAGANDPTPDTALVFNAATVAGTADALSLTLNGNLNVDGTGIGDVTAQGIETFNITTTGSASSINTITSAAVGTINVSGDQNLTIASNLVSAETINASALTGNLSVVVDSGAIDVAVTGGSGNDRADFSNGWDANDTFNGGAGTDTLGLTYTVATTIGATSGTATAVEVLDISTVAGASGVVDMDNFVGVTKVILNAGVATGVTATIDDAVTGLEVEVDVDAAASGTVYADLKTDGTADTITVTLDRIEAGDVLAGVNVEDAETVNLSADDDSTDGTGALTITSLNLTDATTLNLSGDADITVTASVTAATPALKTINASAATGNITISGTNTAAAGATITLGAGNDTINLATSSGADTITLGAGADTINYNAVAQSDSDMDTITDYVAGTDKFTFSFTGAPVLNFRGNQASFGLSQGALTGGGNAAAGVDAVYQVDDQILWVDVDDNGQLDNNDFRIKLTGVASITTADLGLSSTGNTITLSGTTAANVAMTGTPVNADKNTTNFGDTISTTIARLTAGPTIDGALGTDILSVSDAGAVPAIPATITNVETLQLATVGSTANTVAGFNNAGVFTNVTGSSNADTLANTTDLVEGGTISLGDGNDTITALTLFELAGGGADTSYKFNIDMGAGDDTVTNTTALVFTADSVLNGGGGTADVLNLATTSDISLGTVTGFETINLAGTATMTLAQYNAATTVAATAVAANTVTLTTAGTLTTTAVAANVGVETYDLAVGTNTVTLGGAADAARVILGDTGADTLNTTTANGYNTTFTAAGGTDTLNITGGIAGATTITTAGSGAAAIGATGVENLNVSGASTANVLTLVSAAAGDYATVNLSGITGGGVSLTTTGLTADTARTITLTSGQDTITDLNRGVQNLTVDFGTGNATVSDLATNGGTGLLTLKVAATAGATTTVGFTAMTAAFLTGSTTNGTVLDFSGDVTAIALRDIGSAGPNQAGQVIIDNISATAFSILWDADGNGLNSTGDILISVTGGQNYTGGTASIIGGNLYL